MTRRSAARFRGGGTSLRVGVAMVWLSVIVLLPLAAIAWQSVGGGWQAFWLAVTSNAALESFRVTLTISAGVTVLNMVFGLLVAWVLVRDDFPGKRLVDAIIDLPFALPTIVASLVMLALYGTNSPVGLHLQHTGMGCGGGAGVRHAAVRGAGRPAGAARNRPRDRGGGRVAGRQQRDDLHHCRAALADSGSVDRRGADVCAGHRRIRVGGADRRGGARQDRGVLAVDPDPDRKRRPHRRRRDIDCAAGYFVRRAVRSAHRRVARGQARGVGGQ